MGEFGCRNRNRKLRLIIHLVPLWQLHEVLDVNTSLTNFQVAMATMEKLKFQQMPMEYCEVDYFFFKYCDWQVKVYHPS